MVRGFHWINWVIVCGYLAAVAGIGFFFMHRNKTAARYFKADGAMPWWAVALSLYAAQFSSITFLSIPALVYVSDCSYFPITWGAIPAAWIAARWYLPFFRSLNLTSAYEYLEVRFNLGCRLFASAAFCLFMVASTAVIAYLPAIAISAVTGMNVNVAVFTVMLVTVVYSAVGGIEGVIWSDFVQSALLLGSMVLVTALVIFGTAGGFAGFVQTGLEAGKFRVFDFSGDWSTACFWVTLVGGFVSQFVSYTSDQRVVQRYMSVTDVKGAQRSVIAESWLGLFTCLACFVIGVGLWTFYKTHPEITVAITRNDQILPVYIAQVVPNGVSGLVYAAVAAATVSTLAANLNSASSAFTTDFYGRLFHGSDKLLCGRVCTVAAGVLGGLFAIVLANMEVRSIFDQFQRFLGMLTAGLGSLFFLGIFVRRVNGFGAMVGLVANYVVTFGLDASRFARGPHLLVYGFFGFVVCLAVAPVASAFAPARFRKGT